MAGTSDYPEGNKLTGRVTPKRVEKPWGHELIWALTDQYCGKLLHVRAGEQLSVQYHHKKDETVHLLSGEMTYWVKMPGRDKLEDQKLKAGDSFRIAPGTVHYMEAVTDCDVLEAATPQQDDIVRLSDKYGREGTTKP